MECEIRNRVTKIRCKMFKMSANGAVHTPYYNEDTNWLCNQLSNELSRTERLEAEVAEMTRKYEDLKSNLAEITHEFHHVNRDNNK